MIKEFVQETLGCGCPEEVFNQIEHMKGEPIEGGLILRDRIVIGRRLLVYIYEDTDGEDVQESVIRTLLTAGVHERNKNSFNRYRLVLLTQTPEDNKGLSDRTARVIAEFDDRTFAHIIASDSISF
ncbi:MAG: hypothetical protein WC891_00160 [Actinomycetota bacterium]